MTKLILIVALALMATSLAHAAGTPACKGGMPPCGKPPLQKACTILRAE